MPQGAKIPPGIGLFVVLDGVVQASGFCTSATYIPHCTEFRL